MPTQGQEIVRDVWKDNLFSKDIVQYYEGQNWQLAQVEKVVLCPGGAGTICTVKATITAPTAWASGLARVGTLQNHAGNFLSHLALLSAATPPAQEWIWQGTLMIVPFYQGASQSAPPSDLGERHRSPDTAVHNARRDELVGSLLLLPLIKILTTTD